MSDTVSHSSSLWITICPSQMGADKQSGVTCRLGVQYLPQQGEVSCMSTWEMRVQSPVLERPELCEL